MEAGPSVAVALRAKEIASKMFSNIGVIIDWRRHCPADGILISLSDATPSKLMPHALADARPYEGTHIVIFYDRVLEAVEPGVLPHLLVHEITHILQRISRHSANGVMKATWDSSDYYAMRSKPLAFADEDVDLIQRGLAARVARVLVAVNAALPVAAQ